VANEQHLALIRQGAEAVRKARASDPNLKLDLSQATLASIDLSNLDLSGDNFSQAVLVQSKFRNSKLIGTNFSYARLEGADLTGADLSDAGFAGANLSGADLTGVEVTSETKLGSNLEGAKFSNEILSRANIAGAILGQRDLHRLDLSNRDLHAMNFEHAQASGVNFSNSDLTEARFSGANVSEARFRRANLARAQASQANFMRADLVRANFSRANLQAADFTAADVAHANFHEASLNGAVFFDVTGSHLAYLRSTTIHPQNDVRYFDQVIRKWPEWLVDWERIRTFGRLPLFGASYSVLILIPTYLYALSVYNNLVTAARAWIEHSGLSARGSEIILRYLHEEPIPSRWKLLLLSTLSLAVASTIYALGCPPRIKAFSRDQWCDEHRHSLVHYWADAWKMRWLRLICFAMYIVGGLGALWVLLTKLWCAGAILFGSPSACF
jgi:uncharacterized protein YjbI with pentapeptide repeats